MAGNGTQKMHLVLFGARQLDVPASQRYIQLTSPQIRRVLDSITNQHSSLLKIYNLIIVYFLVVFELRPIDIETIVQWNKFMYQPSKPYQNKNRAYSRLHIQIHTFQYFVAMCVVITKYKLIICFWFRTFYSFSLSLHIVCYWYDFFSAWIQQYCFFVNPKCYYCIIVNYKSSYVFLCLLRKS